MTIPPTGPQQGAEPPPIPKLDTPRLHLRGWLPTDVDPWRRICGDPETMRYIGDGTVLPPDRAWHALAHLLGHWALRGYGMWAVTDRDSHALLGRVGFYNPEGWPGLELGWLIARHRWGEGLATEAAHAAAGWASRTLGVSSLISLIHSDNTASVRVAQKLGARFDVRVEIDGAAVDQYRLPLDETERPV